MTTRKKSFLLHIDSLDILDDLSVNQAGLLFKAIKAYQNDEVIEVDEIVKLVFSPFKNQFIRDDEKYNKTCERRAIAGSKGGKQKVANASKCKQELANVADKKNKNKNKTKNKSDNKSKDIVTSEGRFTPPSDIETVAYFIEKGSTNIEAERFWLFYDSKNWMVGKSKMKKWKSSASGWITRNKQGVNNGHQSTGKKLSAYERARAANDKYRQPDERSVVVGADGGHLGRTMDEGTGRETIEHVDNEPFIDY